MRPALMFKTGRYNENYLRNLAASEMTRSLRKKYKGVMGGKVMKLYGKTSGGSTWTEGLSNGEAKKTGGGGGGGGNRNKGNADGSLSSGTNFL